MTVTPAGEDSLGIDAGTTGTVVWCSRDGARVVVEITRLDTTVAVSWPTTSLAVQEAA